MKTIHFGGTAAVAAGILGLLLLALPANVKASDPGTLLPAGQTAPKFEAVDIDGNPFSLDEELTGGPILLVFWSIF